MGLDAVEIVLRTEDLFAITLTDDEAAQVRTVADFYALICSKLNLTPLPSPKTSAQLPVITHKEKFLSIFTKPTPLPAPPEVLPWSPQSIWDTLVSVFVDLQGLKPAQIVPQARIAQDLGVD